MSRTPTATSSALEVGLLRADTRPVDVRTVILLRHASATGQEPDARLTVEGERQAQVLADFLLPLQIQRVISSPFVRATESLRPLSSRAGLRVETDDRLVERVLSAHNLPDWRDHLSRSFDDLEYALEGGESSRTAQARGVAVLQAALASDENSVLVTHGNLLALILKSIDATVGFDDWSRLSNPDAFLIHVEDGLARGFDRIWPRH